MSEHIITFLFLLLQNTAYIGLMLYIANPSIRDFLTPRAGISILLATILILPFQFGNESFILFFAILFFFVCASIIKCNSRQSLSQSFTISFLGYLIGSFLQTACIALLTLFKMPVTQISYPNAMTTSVKLSFIGQCILTIILCGCFPIRSWINKLLSFSRIISIVITILFCILTIFINFFSIDYSTMWSISSAVLIGIIFIGIFIYEEIQMQKKKQTLRDYSTYMPILDDMITLLRQRQHLYANQLLSLSQLLENHSDYDTLCNTIREIIQWSPSEKYSYDFLHLSNRLLAGLLYTKTQSAQEQRIDLEVTIHRYDYTSTCTELEIVDLVGILLDNAIEASSPGDVIYITIGANQNNSDLSSADAVTASSAHTFHFQIENPAPLITNDQLQQMFDKNYTTKPNGNGMGLYIFHKMVQKHNGAVFIYNTTPHTDPRKHYLCIELTI